jgi:hypothetical protein
LESFLRGKVRDALTPLSDDDIAIRQYVEYWKISDILDRHRKVSTLDDLHLDSRLVKSMRDDIFDKRNAMMHGKSVDLDANLLRDILLKAKSIIGA